MWSTVLGRRRFRECAGAQQNVFFRKAVGDSHPMALVDEQRQ